MKGEAIINGHPKEKDVEGHKNGGSNGEAPPTKQNGHHPDTNSTHSKEGPGASIGGKQTSTTPIGGQPTNCATPSYAAAAAKSGIHRTSHYLQLGIDSLFHGRALMSINQSCVQFT